MMLGEFIKFKKMELCLKNQFEQELPPHPSITQIRNKNRDKDKELKQKKKYLKDILKNLLL